MRGAALLIAACALSTAHAGNFHRKKAALRAFVKMQACPSTGKHRLPCPGYVIDHIKPLACGGADAPSNMQWQTRAEAKAKDKWERRSGWCYATTAARGWTYCTKVGRMPTTAVSTLCNRVIA